MSLWQTSLSEIAQESVDDIPHYLHQLPPSAAYLISDNSTSSLATPPVTESTEMLDYIAMETIKKPSKKTTKYRTKSFFKRLFNRSTVDNDVPRIIHINDQSQRNIKFMGNKISTAKYNIASFLPIFLYVEFSKSANLFFLFISGIQQIPNISPTSRYTTLVPLIFVLLLTAVKEIIEDYVGACTNQIVS